MRPPLLTINAAAEFLSVSGPAARRLLGRGELDATRIGRRHFLVQEMWMGRADHAPEQAG